MRRIIQLLTFAVAIFAGYTVWSDPVLGPPIRAMLPESVQSMPVIASNGATPSIKADGTYGGIGAANSVAGSVVGKVNN